jgi:iron complex transport system ATP-binding protein
MESPAFTLCLTMFSPASCFHLMSENLPILQARQISFGYSHRPVLNDLSFSAHRGEFIGIAGPNGAGKSTLLQLLTGYLSTKSGSVSLLGREISQYSRRDIARSIAFVPQSSGISFPFTVMEIVLMGRHPYSGFGALDTREDMDAARQALAALEIVDLEGSAFSALSGGEQQLVLLARMLVQHVPVLILDEPITYLDLRYQWRVLNLLRDHAANGGTVIATLHDLNLAMDWCSRLALLSDGKIIADGPPREVVSAEVLERMYGLALRISQSSGDAGMRIEFPR